MEPPIESISGIVPIPSPATKEPIREELKRIESERRKKLEKELEEREKLRRAAFQSQKERIEREKREQIAKRRTPTGIRRKAKVKKVPSKEIFIEEEPEEEFITQMEYPIEEIGLESLEQITEIPPDILQLLESQQREKERKLEIVGIVGMICSNVEMDLLRVHFHMRNSYFHFTWRSLHTSLTNPRSAIAIYERKGNIVSLGTKSQSDLILSLKKISVVLEKIDPNYKVLFHPPIIVNVVKSTNIPYELTLEGIESDQDLLQDFFVMKGVQALSEFPAKDFLDKSNNILVTVFESGKVIFKIRRKGRVTKLKDVVGIYY